MRRHARPFVTALTVAVSLFVLAPSSFAQTGVLARGMDELVQLYESGSPKLLDALKHHVTSGADEVLVTVHLKEGTTADAALPALKAEGFRLQAVSKVNPRL